MTIVLSPEVEAALAAQAERRGLTPDQLANEILKDNLRGANGAGQIAVNGSDVEEPEDELAEGALYDLFAERIGVINSSEYVPGGANMSQDCGRKFAEGMLEKKRQGKL